VLGEINRSISLEQEDLRRKVLEREKFELAKRLEYE
jgi:hypothetical protein